MEDPFRIAEDMRRYIERRMMEMLEEFQRGYEEMERLFDERLRMVMDGVIEPFVSVSDMGDKYVIVIEAPGAKGSLDIRFGPRTIEVEGYVDEDFVRSALGDMVWARRIRRIRGRYYLPEEIDVERVRVHRRGNTIIIEAPKRGR